MQLVRPDRAERLSDIPRWEVKYVRIVEDAVERAGAGEEEDGGVGVRGGELAGVREEHGVVVVVALGFVLVRDGYWVKLASLERQAKG